MARRIAPLRPRGVATCLVAGACAVSACSRSTTQTLQGGDARVADGPDADRPVDASTGPDATDASLDDGADIGVDGGRDALPDGECRQELLAFDVRRIDADGDEVMLEELEDSAIVVRSPPFTLAFDDGSRLVLNAHSSTNEDLLAYEDYVGVQLDVDVDIYRPFWTEVRVVLLEPGSGRFVGALWSGSRWGEFEAGGLEVRHMRASCTVPTGCGLLRGQRLSISRDGGTFDLAPGDAVETDGLVAQNGESSRYVEGPFCTDTPSTWYHGYAFATRSPDDCDRLARDACIRSPDCALFGSELYDPGYGCHPAATVCERLDATGCAARPRLCAFEDGDCYCPENADCACGGGPPPICRRRCDPRTDEVSCAEDYFCQLAPSAAGALCTPSFDDGRCVRRPATCEGTPESAPPVCGCPEGGIGRPVRFANDCERRRAGGFVGSDDLCAP